MKKACFLIAALWFLSGCASPMRVDEKYWNEAKDAKLNDEQRKTLGEIDREIMATLDEKKIIEEELKITGLKIPLIRRETELTGDMVEIAKKWQDVYLREGSKDKSEKAEKRLRAYEARLTVARLKLEYFLSKRDDQSALLDVKTYALDAKLAQLYYEEAKIARAKQDEADKGAAAAGAVDKGKDRVNVDEFLKFYNGKAEALSKKQKAQEETAKKRKEAENKLMTSKYRGEL